MSTKKMQLSREAMGNRRYKYTVGVAQQVDSTFELIVVAAGLKGEHRMPDPSPEQRPFTASDLDGLDAKTAAFLRAWRDAHPDRGNQILCCTREIGRAHV